VSGKVPFRQETERSVLGIVGTHPGSFRKSGKQRGYRIRNLEEDTENRRLECLKDCRLECWRERGADGEGLTGLPKVSSKNHDPC